MAAAAAFGALGPHHANPLNPFGPFGHPFAQAEVAQAMAMAAQHQHAQQMAQAQAAAAAAAAAAAQAAAAAAAQRQQQQQQQQQQQRSNVNVTVRHPMVTDDRWRRTLHKRRRQRALQMKLDGNILSQQTKSMRRKSDHTYNEINQPIVSNNRTHTNGHNGAAGGVLERAMQFNGALRDRVFSWYRGANQIGREQIQEKNTPHVFSTSENGGSEPKVNYYLRLFLF